MVAFSIYVDTDTSRYNDVDEKRNWQGGGSTLARYAPHWGRASAVEKM